MLVCLRRLRSNSAQLRGFASSARPSLARIRGVIFDAGGVLYASPMAGLATALEGRSASVKDAVARMFGAAAYR